MEKIPPFHTLTQRTALHDLVLKHFRWEAWENLIGTNGITIDRPHHSHHPDYPEIIYPIDYGYINGTLATEGQEIDIFTGSADNGLVGLIVTTDYRKGDQEFKLLYNCSPMEIYLVNGFINFSPTRMDGTLVLRHPMPHLW